MYQGRFSDKNRERRVSRPVQPADEQAENDIFKGLEDQKRSIAQKRKAAEAPISFDLSQESSGSSQHRESPRRPAAAQQSEPAQPRQSVQPRRPEGARQPAPRRPVNSQSSAEPRQPQNMQRPAESRRPESVQRPAVPQRPVQPQNPNLQFNVQFDEQPQGYEMTPVEEYYEEFTDESSAPVVMKRNWTGTLIGGVIFYLLLALGIGGFLLSLNGSLHELTKELNTYEKLQPTYVSQQMFTQLFSTPDWGVIYDNAHIELSKFEGKEAFVKFMTDRVGNSSLVCQKVPGSEENRIQYDILLEKETIASFFMKNESTDPQAPAWELDGIQVYFEAEGVYRISGSNHQTVKVNGIQLDDRSLLEEKGKRFTQDLGEGAKEILLPGTRLYEVDGLLTKPSVTVEDEQGNSLEVSYDEQTHTFAAPVSQEEIPEEAKNLALEAVTTYCKFMIKKANRGELGKYFNPNTDTYKAITASDLTWIQKENGHSVADPKITDYVRIDENTFSIRVSLTWQLIRKDNSVKKSPVDVTLVFEKEAGGKWRCSRMTGVEFVEPYNTVRVRFMHENTVISSVLVHGDDKTISCPSVGVPEGRKLAGWVTVMQDENGQDYYQRVLEPDDTGMANVPEGLFSKPVDLHPVHVSE